MIHRPERLAALRSSAQCSLGSVLIARRPARLGRCCNEHRRTRTKSGACAAAAAYSSVERYARFRRHRALKLHVFHGREAVADREIPLRERDRPFDLHDTRNDWRARKVASVEVEVARHDELDLGGTGTNAVLHDDRVDDSRRSGCHRLPNSRSIIAGCLLPWVSTGIAST